MLLLQTLENRCTDMNEINVCNYTETCLQNKNDLLVWERKPGTFERPNLNDKLKKQLERLYSLYSVALGARELWFGNRPDDSRNVRELKEKAMAKLDAIRKDELDVIETNEPATFFGICLRALVDMQTVADEYFNQVINIRGNVCFFKQLLNESAFRINVHTTNLSIHIIYRHGYVLTFN